MTLIVAQKSERQTGLKAGIIGAGLMGRWHAEAIRKVGGNLIAIVDTDATAAQRLARRFPGAEIFSTVESLLQQPQLDVLHICTPLPTHTGIAEAAIAVGTHLLVEKPLTSTAAETERLYQLAAKRRLLLCPVHQFLFQDGVQKAEHLLSGIGNLVHLEATICSAGGRGVDPIELDSIIADVLPHPLSLLQLFLPSKLPIEWKTLRPRPGEFRALGQESTVTVAIFISMNARPTSCSFQLKGTEGTIYIDLFHGYAYKQLGKVSKGRKILQPFDASVRQLWAATANLTKRAIHRTVAYPGLEQLVHFFYQAVRTTSPPPILPEDVLAIAHTRDWLLEKAAR